jgi:prephenate dehydratase
VDHRVGYQGEPGAYSEEAVNLLFGEAEPVPCRTLRAVFAELEVGRLDHAVVPIENSLAGSVLETYDLLASAEASIVGEAVVRVDHALLALPGVRMEEVRRVASHPQALAQCEEFLSTLEAEQVPVYDTAGAAKRLAEEQRRDEAAIASERAASVYGLNVLARSIQTSSSNQTRFVAVARNAEPLGPADKTSLVLVVGNTPGALYRALRPFAERKLNLSKLESRPLGEEPWQYRFYLDVEAGANDPGLRQALHDLETAPATVQVLGSYPRWRGARRA